MSVDYGPYQREPVYPLPEPAGEPVSAYARFRLQSGNGNFRTSALTWVSVIFLLIVYPGISMIGTGDDPTALLKSLNQGMVLILLLSTIMFQWIVFLLNYVSMYREQTGLAGIGLRRIRLLDFGWAFAFLLAAFAVMSGVEWVLGQIGLPLSGEVGVLIPKDPFGKVVWVAVAATAGFCEEVAFRGYLMTRLRLLGRMNSWILPTILSTVAFAACHSYQGWSGFIAIVIYGVLFSLLFIRTGSLWPAVIAHFLWDFGALFYPK